MRLISAGTLRPLLLACSRSHLARSTPARTWKLFGSPSLFLFSFFCDNIPSFSAAPDETVLGGYRGGTPLVNTKTPYRRPMPKKDPEESDSDRTQYKIRIQRQLIGRLSRLGRRCGYSTGNEFAADALDQYAELLADLIEEQHLSQADLRRRQHEEVIRRTKEGRR